MNLIFCCCILVKICPNRKASMAKSEVYTNKFVDALVSCNQPVLKNAYGAKSGTELIINTAWTQTNFLANEKHEFNIIYIFESGSTLRRSASFPLPLKPYVLEKMSPTSKFCAGILKHKNQETAKDEFILEIWSSIGIVNTFNLSAFDQHGIVHSDVVFGSLSWSQDESKILYLSEKKKGKPVSFFDQRKNKNTEEKEEEKFLFEESWGERLCEVVNPVMCILDINEETLRIIKNVPDDVSPAQPQFRGNDTILFEGMKNAPFRLGRLGCECRESQIYSLSTDDSSRAKALVPNYSKSASFCPRVSPDGKKVLFLQRKLRQNGDAHRSAENIIIYSFERASLINIEKFEFSEECFSIFVHSLPSFCWFKDSVHVAVACFSQFKRYLCVLNTDTQKVVLKYQCNGFFGVYYDLVLTSFMKLDSKNCILQLSRLNEVIEETGHEKEEFDVLEIVDNNITSYGIIPRECQMASGKYPVILWPHGGPHINFADTYLSYASALCKVGFVVILANYRGSNSYTVESLYSLPGKIGSQDVQDVKKVLELFLDQYGTICDRQNVFTYGGSHGGFLIAHQIGQFPGLYRAAALRNPVVDILAMAGSSDIIDWAYFEAGLTYQQDILPTSESATQMLEKSPIIHIKNIQSPVLLFIGLKDERVPSSQGMMYYKLLKANNKQVKMLAYPNDGHSLTSIKVEGDVFVSMCKWFFENGVDLEFKTY